MSKDQYTKEDELKDAIDNTELETNQEETQEEKEVEAKEEAEIVPTAEELLAEEKNKYLRLFAEFENYKKRTSKERVELFKTAGQQVMTALLPILDDFERASAHAETNKKETKKLDKEASKEIASLNKGMSLIQQKLVATLEQKGLTSVEVKSGDTFDADVHQAITQIPAPSDKLKGKIIDCVEKGYKLGDKIIRHPKVVVGQA
ncbi:nucleotide exchange factor GrpE [Tenacibaculum finnmarkense genomovar finnmarkense]|uniref:nucleotide exchange factor GrpE n=1 Tax=Tenacibaculum finnmarkense TaxID=2781243 RepID=UPI000C5817B2|nr:nucleotide exchange factor GrpE [Tenacibaculum finnmarkense]MBE7660318.1 nucleotide exchange factor GrpE [Tenacibaculum finnmarkense genomovar finnmarkense]MBE7693179.1 nucleotide exchange factor GrpE [Tenacibaculum finnmarkense genomovar finnmarkense]MCD8403195.1 nucleotide exchange factor GrpE [Tenacibaculum finnmarkense genomovar finnmarkense]MCD8411828.1 nucleotide exchange factor GrpE [Tenacibaculum finnmarkense genomovar ulcerans]MCD8417543.1 nucleotide exchange factor GrpE [Tenacibac